MENVASLQAVQIYPVGEASAGSAPNPGSSNINGRFPENRQSDRVSLSPEARKLHGELVEKEQTDDDSGSAKDVSSPQGPEGELSDAELQEILKLRQRDQEVKAHEQAHLATAGQHAAGGPSYTYEVGPDGRRYAVGGEVPIDMSKEKTPEETIQKMQIVARAALAPANPSPADRRIAARAAMLSAQARADMQSEKTNESALNRKNAADSGNGNEHDTGDTASSVSGTSPSQSSSAIPPVSRQLALKAYQVQAV